MTSAVLSPPRRRTALIAVLGLSSLMTGLDFTIVYVALPDIGRALRLSAADLQWVISGYAIPYGGLLLLAGRLGDAYGLRRTFLVGMVVFALGSAAGGLAWTDEALVAARVAQGVGAAVLFPTTLALVQTSFPDARSRAAAVSVWAAAGAAGLSLGALAGGVLTALTGWPGIFWVNLPVAAVCLVLGARLLPRPGPQGPDAAPRRRELDVAGAVLGTVGVALAVFVLGQAAGLGWSSPLLIGGTVVAGVTLVAFGLVERRALHPVLPVHLLRSAPGRVVAVILVFGISLNVVPFVLTSLFSDVLAMSPLVAGTAFLLPTLVITAGNLLGPRLVAAHGSATVLALGMLLGAVGAALLAVVLGDSPSYLRAVPGLVLFAAGLGVAYPSMFSAATRDVPDADQGAASATAAAALQIGSAIGLAVLTIVAATIGPNPGPSTGPDTLRAGLHVIVLVAVAGALLAVRTGRASVAR